VTKYIIIISDDEGNSIALPLGDRASASVAELAGDSLEGIEVGLAIAVEN
jgi:hypothetical protein